VAYDSSNRALELILGSFGENILFKLTVRIVLTTSMGVAPEDFIKDRSSLYFEPGWTVEEMQNSLPSGLLQFQSAFELINHHDKSSNDYRELFKVFVDDIWEKKQLIIDQNSSF